jgi:hypothetical protein
MTRPTPALDRAVDWLSQILLREQRASTILRLAASMGPQLIAAENTMVRLFWSMIP